MLLFSELSSSCMNNKLLWTFTTLVTNCYYFADFWIFDTWLLNFWHPKFWFSIKIIVQKCIFFICSLHFPWICCPSFLITLSLCTSLSFSHFFLLLYLSVSYSLSNVLSLFVPSLCVSVSSPTPTPGPCHSPIRKMFSNLFTPSGSNPCPQLRHLGHFTFYIVNKRNFPVLLACQAPLFLEFSRKEYRSG